MRKNLSQHAYAHICRKLASGELPPGSHLSTRALAKEMGVSFIPVREAISKLATKGLVEHQPGLGAFVPESSPEELYALYDLREALECHTVAKVAGRLSEAELTEMASQNDMLSVIIDELQQAGRSTRDPRQLDRWLAADAAFHTTLLQAGGNPRVLRTVNELQLMARIFSHLVEDQSLEHLRVTHGDHCRILDALRLGDAEQARTAMAEHIRGRYRVLEAQQRGDAEQARTLLADRLRPRRQEAAEVPDCLCGEDLVGQGSPASQSDSVSLRRHLRDMDQDPLYEH